MSNEKVNLGRRKALSDGFKFTLKTSFCMVYVGKLGNGLAKATYNEEDERFKFEEIARGYLSSNNVNKQDFAQLMDEVMERKKSERVNLITIGATLSGGFMAVAYYLGKQAFKGNEKEIERLSLELQENRRELLSNLEAKRRYDDSGFESIYSSSDIPSDKKREL